MSDFMELIRTLKNDCQALEKLLVKYEKNRTGAGISPYEREKDLAKITEISARLPDYEGRRLLRIWLDTEKVAIEKAKDDFRFSFGQEIKKTCETAGFPVRGQYPLLRVGPYTLKLNFEFGRAELYFGPEVEKIKTGLPMDPAVLVKFIKDFHHDLKPDDFDASGFGRELREAYRRKIGPAGKSSPEKVPLLEILREMLLGRQKPQFFADPRKENFREYSRVHFAFDLYRLRQSDVPGLSLHLFTATFDATADRQAALWVPDNENGDGTHYSHLAFDR
jgi:hypothetical protein